MYDKQVSKNHYSFEHYFFPGRWMSYYYQVLEIAKRKDIETVLDIGPGTAFLKDQLKMHRPLITYKTLDVANDVNPDFVGSITKIPLPDGSYDAVCAFQVLEHIEFSDVESALGEMCRVSKKYIMVSVPHFGPAFELHLKIPFLKRFRIAFRIPYPVKHVFNGQHYWELGKRGYPVSRFRDLLKKFGTITSEYIPFEYQYHHFFVLEKNSH